MKVINCLIIMLCFVFLGCTEDENTDGGIWEIPINSIKPTIEIAKGDFAFKFCLLDDNNNPSTKFKEGENIHFYLSLENLSKEEIILEDKFFAPDFFMIYNEENKEVGKPFTGVFCTFEMGGLPRWVEIKPDETVSFHLPWTVKLGEWVYADTYPFCLVESDKEPLKVGKYSCKVPINLDYTQKGKGKMLLIINFEIL